MLDVEVIPSKSVGEFKIGMPMSAAISYIQKSYKTISTVDLKYCEEDLLNTYLLIDLKDEGLLLRFEPRTQRLHSVEVHDLTRVVLRYCGAAFSGPDTQPTFDLIYRRFGPSFPGEYNPETRIYCLDYPGVTFLFPIPEHAHFDGSASDLPIEFADGTSPEVARMLVYHGEKTDTSIPPLDPKDDYFGELRVHASHGIRFMRRGCRLDFQSTAQDVLTELGRPDRTFYKHEDKMKIHSGDQAIIGAGCEDYFYNYFKLGLDVLFDMRTHVVKKFIFHTNFPCHHDFNVYNKCNFKLFFGSPDEVDSASESEGAESSGADETPDEEEVEPAAPKRRSARDHNGEEEEEEEEEDQEDEEPLQRANGGPKGGNNTNNGGKKNNNKKNKKKNRSRRGRGGPARVDDNDDNDDAEELARSPDGKKNGAKPGAADVRPAATRDKGKGKDKGKERDDGVPAVEAKGVAKPLHYIHPDMKWEEMQQVLPGAPSKPVVNTTSSPFGSTLFYGHKDLIFEVMRNGHVASICMFSSSSSSSA